MSDDQERSATGRPERPRAPWRAIATIALIGVAVRGLLMWLALPLDIQSDEANYLYLAIAREHLGVYFDQHRYLWPPGYPWLLQQFVAAFGIDGLNLVRGFQVLLSSVIGTTTMLFAWRFFSKRAAIVAGVIWAVDLPLGAFTHFLWTETVFLALFLPALWHLTVGLDRQETTNERSGTVRFLASGVLFGIALYVKEMPLYLVPALGLVILWRSWDLGAREAVRRATLVPLTAFVVLLPWTLRNAEVYGTPVLSGATLGENVFIGLNSRQMNFDIVPLAKVRAKLDLPPMAESMRTWFVEPAGGPAQSDTNGDGSIDVRDAGWERADDVVHAIDRQDVQLREGLEYAIERPGWLVRTRLKKLSDFVTPLSFFTRHHALGQYPDGSAMTGFLRVPLVGFALLHATLLMLLGAAGLFLTLRRGPARAVVVTVIGYVALTSLLVAMSRFRAPIEPLLIVMSAGFLSHGIQERSKLRLAGLAATLLALVSLWWVSFPEIVAAARMALGFVSGDGGQFG